MSHRLLTNCKMLAALILVTSIASPALAQDDVGYGDEWQHALAVYAWGAGIGGQTASGSGIDVGFDTLLDNLEMAFMGAYQARKDRWSIVADLVYLDVGQDKPLQLLPPSLPDLGLRGAGADVSMEGVVFQFAGGYNLFNRDGSNADFLFGARYLDLSSHLRLDFTLSLPDEGFERRFDYSASGGNWDAFVGIKGNLRLADRWFIRYRGDIGAGESDLTWVLSGGIAYQASDRVDVALIYRHMAWDLGGELIADVDFSGPALGAIFRF